MGRASTRSCKKYKRGIIRDAFDVVDIGGTGSISKFSVGSLLSRLSIDLSPAQLAEAFKEMQQIAEELVAINVRSAFDIVDRSNTGFVSTRKDVLAVVKQLSAVDNIVRDAEIDFSDVDPECRISFEDLLSWWQSKLLQHTKMSQVRAIFQRVDRDKSGTLTKRKQIEKQERAYNNRHRAQKQIRL